MTMSSEWDYQIRFGLTDEAAALAHDHPADARLQPLMDALARHKATIASQYDAFAGYCAEAEREGVETYPLYKWTKATIDDPVKKAKHRKIFTCYLDGAEVYAKDKADALEADLLPLVGGGLIEKVNKYDTNPANNPQAPAHLQG
jgi:hypothetical protein